MIKKLGTNTFSIEKNHLKPILNLKKASNFLYRIIFGFAMLTLYLFLTSQSVIYIIGISLTLLIGIIYELISITKKKDKPFPINKYLLFLITSVLFLDKFIPAIALFYPKMHIFVQLTHIKPFLFTLYAMCLISIVMKLSRKNLRSQVRSPSTYNTTSTICSRYFGQAISPPLVT